MKKLTTTNLTRIQAEALAYWLQMASDNASEGEFEKMNNNLVLIEREIAAVKAHFATKA